MRFKQVILKPLVLILYRKMLRSAVKDDVYQDLHLWSIKQFGETRDEKELFLTKMLGDPKFRTLFYYRFNCSSLIKKIIPGQEMLWINPSTDIVGGGVFFVHPWCTRIFAKKIGKNCTIRQMTTIGTNGKPGMEDFRPVIGNNVEIGCMCGIFGDITVGNNVKIGAGTIVTKNIPDNCVVVGNPARIIKKDGQRVNIPL